jgi:chromosome segregation ATPase
LTRLETVLNEERQKAESTIENLQRESKELRKNERCREQDFGSKFRQSNSEIESLKLELAETSASLSTCLKNNETLEQNLSKFKNENEQINEEFVHVKKTNKILGEKLERWDQSGASHDQADHNSQKSHTDSLLSDFFGPLMSRRFRRIPCEQ